MAGTRYRAYRVASYAAAWRGDYVDSHLSLAVGLVAAGGPLLVVGLAGSVVEVIGYIELRLPGGRVRAVDAADLAAVEGFVPLDIGLAAGQEMRLAWVNPAFVGPGVPRLTVQFEEL